MVAGMIQRFISLQRMAMVSIMVNVTIVEKHVDTGPRNAGNVKDI